ncbi:MAG: acyltransferase [Magnetococcales bacterium]|nr:acyltransferase [Magnetococcales bacterium]
MVKSLHGLRGWASIIVFLGHILSSFYPNIVDKIALPKQQGYEFWLVRPILYFFINSGFAVSLFFMLSGFVLSSHFFMSYNKIYLINSALRRYFRLTIPIMFVAVLIYAMERLDLFCRVEFAKVTGNVSFLSILPFELDFSALILNILSYSHINQYNPVFWTMRHELIGSFLVFGLLLVIGGSRYRFFSYLFFTMFWWDHVLKLFIIGIAISDVFYTTKRFDSNGTDHIKFCLECLREIALFLFFIFGVILGYISNFIHKFDMSNFLFSYSYLIVMDADDYAVLGSFLIIIASLHSRLLSLFFSGRISSFLGDISFSVYLLHIPILYSIGHRLFVILMEYKLTYVYSFAVASFAIIIFTIAVSYLFFIYVDNKITKTLKAYLSIGKTSAARQGRITQWV